MNGLSGIGFGFLVVVDAVPAERHVSRAAVRLNKDGEAMPSQRESNRPNEGTEPYFQSS